MSLPILTIGFFGGSAPSLIKAAAALHSGADILPFTYGFWGGVLLYGIIGGVVAFALGEQSHRGALFAGIAAPALVSNAITGVQADRANVARTPVVIDGAVSPGPRSDLLREQRFTLSRGWLIPQARAQATPAGEPAPVQPPDAAPSISASGRMRLYVQFQSGSVLREPMRLCVTNPAAGDSCAWSAEVASPTDIANIPVPPGAALVVNGTPVPIDFTSRGVAVDVRASATPLSDFHWALGGRRQVGNAQIVVAPLSASQIR